MLSRSSTAPSLPSRLRSSTSHLETSSTPITTGGYPSFSQAAFRANWIEGLKQYTNFRLHAALSTFKSLLRDLRRAEGESASATIIADAHSESPPCRILPPKEVALLYINIALIHGYLGSYFLAAASFEEALLLDEASGIAWFGLGIARFYLRELGACKRAFGRCQACFVAHDENGAKHLRDVLTYTVWVTQPGSDCGSAIAKENRDPASTLDPWSSLTSMHVRHCPEGLWTLERARVEWNWRIAVFERNYVRKGIERPGSGKWGLNGIPAGVIFGPDPHIAAMAPAEYLSPGNDFQPRASRPTIVNPPRPLGDAKSRTGSLVKQKWTQLQQKVLRRKSTIALPSPPLRRIKSSESLTSSGNSNDESKANEDRAASQEATSGRATRSCPGTLRKPLSITQSLIQDQLHNISSDDLEKARLQHRVGSRGKPSVNPASSYPTRRSSLTLASPRSSYERHRSSRTSLFAINSKVQDIGNIEEESMESDFVGSWMERSAFSEGGPPEIEDVSPKDTRNNLHSYGALPNASAPLDRTEEVLSTATLTRYDATQTLPSIRIPQTATSSQYGTDSFMTDNISPLSSHLRSAMFPSLSTRRSSSARRPSYATDISDLNLNATDSEEHEHQHRREHPPSSIISFTSATSEKSAELLPGTANLLYDLVESYNMAPSSGEPHPLYLDMDLDGNDIAVPPIDVPGRERMSITGRTCLGEWEWEEAYERWREKESLASNTADDDDDDETIGEMLLPRRFESHDKNS